MLSRCVALGILVSDERILADLPARLDSRSRRVTKVFVPTTAARGSAATVLESYLSNADRFGHDVDALVAADSEDPEHFKSLEVICKRAAIITRDDRRALANRLAKAAQIDPEIVCFALLGTAGETCAVGACRNTMLLLTAGEVILNVDDDAPCRTAPTGRTDRLLLFPPNGTAQFIRPLCAGAGAPTNWQDIDLIGAHEMLLGYSLGDCARSFADTVQIGSGHLLSYALHDTSQPVVRMTQSGLVGDCARMTPWFLVSAAEAHGLEWLNNDTWCRSVLDSRLVSQSAAQYTITTGGDFMTFCFGLDNRDLLPPFPPVWRGEDSVFSALASICGAALAGVIPVAVEHAPPVRRGFSPGDLAATAGGGAASWLVECVVQLYNDGRLQAEDRIARCGTCLKEIAKSAADFEQWVRTARRRVIDRQSMSLEQILERPPRESSLWRRALSKALEECQRLSSDSGRPCPPDLLDSDGLEAGFERFRSIVERYGRVLEIWPALWAASADLKTSNQLESICARP